MNRLSETLVRGNNNFDLIRFMAAVAVMLGHSYAIQGATLSQALMLRLTHLESFGSVAVYAFFMISGMLVSASFANRTSIWKFIGLRMLRIWPGAAVCAAFIALVVGPIFSELPLAAYLSDAQTYEWLFHNASLIAPVGGPLPQLFEGNRLASMANATVWTLPVEVKCYVIVLVAGLLGCIGSKRRTVVVAALLGSMFAILVNDPPEYLALRNFFVLQPAYSFYPVPFFLLGMLLYAFREHVRLDGKVAIVLLGGYLATRYSWFGPILFYPTLVYGVLWLGATPALRRFAPKHDYSYGIYLYGFVVQQALASCYPTMNSYLSLVFALPVTMALAVLSWHAVERPCLAVLRRPRGVSTSDAGGQVVGIPGS